MMTAGVLILAMMSLSAAGLSAEQKKTGGQSGKININTASVAKLSELPGIGPKKAERIIAYRKKYGRFRRIQEIMKVKGIGEKTFKKFSGRIRV